MIGVLQFLERENNEILGNLLRLEYAATIDDINIIYADIDTFKEQIKNYVYVASMFDDDRTKHAIHMITENICELESRAAVQLQSISNLQAKPKKTSKNNSRVTDKGHTFSSKLPK